MVFKFKATSFYKICKRIDRHMDIQIKNTTDMKRKIIPPHGNPFIDIHINNLGIYNNYKLKEQ